MSPSLVGIIANPASGRDIRRLVAHGTVFDNNEKTAIIRRVLVGLASVGATRVAYMPEHDFGIVPRALAERSGQRASTYAALTVEPLTMPLAGTSADSTLAATLLAEAGAGCIITLGGDGTNRAVAKGSGAVPLIAISTGTNNVFPSFIEGTLAGIAAGLIANSDVGYTTSYRSPWMEVSVDGAVREYALVDVVASAYPFVGTRAIWDLDLVREVVLARVAPATIGLSSLGGMLLDHEMDADQRPGMHVVLGSGGKEVLAALAPGLVQWVGVRSHRRLAVDDVVQLQQSVGTIALDGEREIECLATTSIEVRLCADGPVVVDVAAALAAAARSGSLHR
ncbi:ATP-NAD kinase [Reticulibacter mediterranei]|uniref:ATP-NAD kinase n=1 Tax=Reticulibacter mediterranei TaxID=2778369 RepID=A0A8J3II82_9CHLR|nr:NAD(+)/NADH kinase [Reticulibacter mediterranei]GHO95036.1 ATP-NAD kinase [Reticulibacter mediterranei]